MKYISTLKRCIQLLVLLTAYSQGMHSFASAKEQNPKVSLASVKVSEFDLYHAAKQRPIKLDLWYKEQQSAKSLNIAILSHGAMGSAKDYSWLAYPLAAKGWTVIGLNHFGESWRYGRQNIDPSSVMRFWQRSEDVSYVIDSLETFLPKELVSNYVNVVVIGHSSGGFTAASLAGVSLDAKQIYDYCASLQAKGDLGCSYGERQDTEKSHSVIRSIASGLDNRVTGIIMLDPALGPAATETSLKKVSLPTLVIGSQNNDFLPFDYHAKRYAQHIPNAKLIALNDGEGHFVYINSCDNNYKARGISLCKDREGVNRQAVHQKVIGNILHFLIENT